ncbi:MAG TPA: hypothetical protein PKI32_09435, partial [Opitutales bacterium]|nr:hypothetical protein [Opitutales bacterium]
LLNDQRMSSALTTAVQVNDCLANCNWNAYIWWKVIGDANGLLNNAGQIQNRGYVFAQFSRFIRPGDRRIDTSGSPDPALRLSAYRDPNSGRFAILVINNTAAPITQTFNLANLSATFVKPWRTNETEHMAMQPDIPVVSGSFTCTIPAGTVETFVGNPETRDYDSSAWYAPYVKNAGGRIESDDFGTLWAFEGNVAYQENLHWVYCDKAGGWVYFYAYNGLGWMAAQADSFPYVYLYGVPTADGTGTESGWAYAGDGGDGVWLYFFGGSRHNSGTVAQYPGWWRFNP